MGRRTAVSAVVAMFVVMATALTGLASTPPARFGAPVPLPGGAAHTEPSLVVDSAGRAFISAIPGIGSNTTSGEMGSPIWRSTDYQHWQKLKTTSVGPAGSPLGGGDSALGLDDKGDIFMTDLWLGDDSISISEDHGNSFVGSPVSHRLADDRTWLAFSKKDQALYQVYDGLDGVYISRADLNTPLGPKAALVSAFNQRIVAETPISGPALDGLPVRQAVAPPGGIAVDQRTGAVYVTYSDQKGVAFAVSSDKGLTWTISHIPTSSATGSYLDTSWNFVPVATDSAGRVYVLWSQVQGQSSTAADHPNGIALRLAVSSDHGHRWRIIRVRAAATALLPALAVRRAGHPSVAWVDARRTDNPNGGSFSDARWSLKYAEIDATSRTPCQTTYTVDAHAHSGTLFSGQQGGDRGMGDFFQITATSHNAALVAYTQGTERANRAMASYLRPHPSTC
jgi:hypothetical protein